MFCLLLTAALFVFFRNVKKNKEERGVLLSYTRRIAKLFVDRCRNSVVLARCRDFGGVHVRNCGKPSTDSYTTSAIYTYTLDKQEIFKNHFGDLANTKHKC